jgi:hypothetical protein
VQNLKIIPYVAIDGIMTFTDTSILSLYDRMVKDGTHEIVFYAGHITGRESFLKYMKRPSVMLFVLIRNKDHIGFTWLDGIEMITEEDIEELVTVDEEAGHLLKIDMGMLSNLTTAAVRQLDSEMISMFELLATRITAIETANNTTKG